MKSDDTVMQDVWKAKEANARRHQSLATYVAYLRKQSRQTYPGGRVAALKSAKLKSPNKG